jgi:oligopeptide transport system substrate-binding protein
MFSKDDIGLSADDDRITISFKHDIDPEEFLRKTASPALVPLRSSVVNRYYNWSSASSTMVCNGPFFVRSYSPGDNMQLARNAYYHREPDNDDVSPTKFVKPYSINIDFKLNGEEMMKAYENGELFYISELPCDKETRKLYEERVKLTDTLSTHTYFFNTAKAPFDNKTVRQVLGGVIDRAALVEEVVYAYAATGVVPKGLNDLTDKDDFADKNTAKLPGNAAMSVSEVRASLQQLASILRITASLSLL